MLIAVILAVIGGVLTAGGVTAARANARFRRRAERAQGTIVELQLGASPGDTVVAGGSGPLYYPVVAFTTGEGRPIRARSAFGANPAPGRVGDTVTVLYDPRDPHSFRLDRFAAGGGCVTAALLVAGLTVLAVAAIVLATR